MIGFKHNVQVSSSKQISIQNLLSIHSDNHHPPCFHTKTSMQSSSQSLPLQLKVETLSSFPFPTSVQQTLKEMACSHSAIIQRVSEKSFVIRTVTKSFQTPLKLLHVRFDSENNFHCQCSQFKAEKLSSATTAPKPTKRCIHLYICMWAFLSRENLQQEFSTYLHQFQPEGMHTITLTVVN